MIQRIALFTASLAAALAIGLGLALAGVGPAASTAAIDTTPAATTATADPTPAPTVQVDTVYVAAQAKPKTVTVHKTVAAPRGDDEGQGEDD
jgi:hypothetical protein